jgi:hypothetical protein
MKTLKLTLKRKWFDMIASGVKREEYRLPSEWILSRLQDKQYDAVCFRNGYSAASPTCTCIFDGWGVGFGRPEWGAPEGVPVIIIRLGKVL